MLHKTTGIIFKTTHYAESSIIIKIYTEKFGLQTYIVNGIRKLNTKSKAGIYRHGNILDMVVYYRENGNIFRISEAKFAIIYKSIPFHIVKSSLLLFYIEILNKVIKEEEQNSDMYYFISETLQQLDDTQENTANHHLVFLLELSKLLGFYPAATPGDYFDLKEGFFSENMPKHSFFMDEHSSFKLKGLLITNEAVLTNAERKILLHHLLNYFKLHVDGFGELKSPAILEELFRS